MNFAKLIIFQPDQPTQEFEIQQDLVSIGRALDNTIVLEADSNVSRYHAEIEKRGDVFYFIDLGSSNGTTLNDGPLDEARLRNEDLICLGGSTLIEFYESDFPWVAPNDKEQPQVQPTPVVESPLVQTPVQTPPLPPTPAASSNATEPVKKIPLAFVVGGVVGGIVLVAVAALVISSLVSPGCKPTARIVNPRSGTTIQELTTLRVEVENPKCINQLIYLIDGRTFVSVKAPPYEVELDPAGLSNVGPGTHNLSVTIEDKDGKQILQAGSVRIGFETRTATESAATAPEASSSPEVSSSPAETNAISENELRELCVRFAKEFTSSKTNYRYDPEFLRQVQMRTSEYARQGFSQRARAFRDPINRNFIDQRDLDEPLGYVLAMSRSGFVLSSDSSDNGQGLWQMSQSFAERVGYNGLCGTETLSDPKQDCAAQVAATYSKTLVTVVFEGDFLYGVACFSMNPQEAEAWAGQLPPDRADFWRIISRPEQRERVVRFFAAGIVGENPEKFNLPDRKLSSLYPKR